MPKSLSVNDAANCFSAAHIAAASILLATSLIANTQIYFKIRIVLIHYQYTAGQLLDRQHSSFLHNQERSYPFS